MARVKEYCAVLGLNENAGLESIKSAYRELAKKYHPDVSKEPNAEERFVDISEAYEFLVDYYAWTDAKNKNKTQVHGPRNKTHRQKVRKPVKKSKTWQGTKKAASKAGSIGLKFVYLFIGFVLSTFICIFSYVAIVAYFDPSHALHVLLSFFFFFLWIVLAVFLTYLMSTSKKLKEFFN